MKHHLIYRGSCWVFCYVQPHLHQEVSCLHSEVLSCSCASSEEQTAHWHCWCIHWVCPYFKKLVNVLMLDFKTVSCLLHKCFLKACVQGKLVPRSTHFKTLYAAVN